MNSYELERLVIKTYHFVKDTVPDTGKHRDTVVNIILTMFRTSRLPFDEDYFVENIRNTLCDVLDRHEWKLSDETYQAQQIFIHA